MNLLSLAIAPVALLLIYIFNKDYVAKEPTKALVKAFVGSCFVVLLDLLLLWPFRAMFGSASDWEGVLWSSFGQSFFEAGIPEELCKFAVLYLLVWKSKEFDEHFDGIVYATYVSMGFACIENIFYVLFMGPGTGILRAFTAVPGHFFFGVIMGYYFSRAKFDPARRASHLCKAICLPMVVHGLYDWMLFLSAGLVAEDDAMLAVAGAILLGFFFFNFKLWRHGLRRIEELRQMDVDENPKPEGRLRRVEALQDAGAGPAPEGHLGRVEALHRTDVGENPNPEEHRI